MLLRTLASSFAPKQLYSRSLVRSLDTCHRATTRSMSSQKLYWNREESTPRKSSSDAPIVKPARIVSLSDPNDDANRALHQGDLPQGATLLAFGTKIDEFDVESLKKEEPNVLFVSHPKSREPLVELLEALPSLEWIHARSAGIDFVTSPGLARSSVLMTNAKGHFSSTLAEYTMMACSYFAKDLPRLMRQKKDKNWSKYPVLELRGATLGIIGYGDIGRACAKLANAYGMRVVALRRNPQEDPLCDAVYSNDTASLHRLMAESDYILVATPLTEETRGLIGQEELQQAKQDAVLINLGRGPVVDEDALTQALQDGTLKGAALDVFTVEPLPKESKLWALDNVLLSPHNMDMTATFMHEATEFFIRENLPRFIRGEELLNEVDKVAGY